tara:strand:- start:79 stop:675 length:597 start_codon:yes stop_codon:yes gene_type:complete
MNKKIIIQLMLFLTISSFIILLFYKYSIKKDEKNSDKKEIIIPFTVEKNLSNSILNIEYNSSDNLGNQYSIKAKEGIISDENSNLILMKGVEASIILDNYEKITINAISATYNIINYDTNFRKSINIKHNEHNITCDNVDLLFKDHKIKLYKNIIYNDLSTNLLADKMEIDLLTKNLKIYMINQDQKIKVIYKNNVGN